VTKVSLDAREVKAHGVQTIGEPVDGALPEFVQTYLDKAGLAFDHGTVVVWVEPDRLSYRKPALMKEHLVDDFGVTYRYLLDRVDLIIDGMKVAPVDPLFLTPDARYYLKTEEGGAKEEANYNIPVRYVRDAETGAPILKRITEEDEIDPNDPDLLAMGAIAVKVSRFPYGFEIRKKRRGMSFVRAGREIETVDVFPKSIKDQANGLGNWPLLQSYAYHWGVEVRFTPVLDEVFGITNDKQTVRPIEDFWRILSLQEIDKQLGREQAHQRKIRQEAQEAKRRAKAQRSEEPTIAETAAAAADTMAGQSIRVPERQREQARTDFDKEVKRRAKQDKVPPNEVRAALEADAKRRPYIIDFYEEPRGPFYKPEWQNGSQVGVLINKQHSFFQTLYGPLLKLPHGAQAKNALDILLIALARAELTVDNEETANIYLVQRERIWSEFLTDAYRSLQQKMEPVDEETAEGGDDHEELEAAE
jgi:hypothetical protein